MKSTSNLVGYLISALGLCFFVLAPQTRASVIVQIGQNFTGSTFGIDSHDQPPDANGAAGPNHFVEFINGRYSVYNKSNGSRVQTKTDVSFLTSSGITIGANLSVTDPRIVYDPYSQHWFASMVDFNPNSFRLSANRFLLAVSESSDPTGRWHGVAFAADLVTSYFADFPTLGVDANGVYLSGDMFNRNNSRVGPTLVSIPKQELLAIPPDISGRKSFGVLSYNTRGSIMQPVMTTGAASTEAIVLAVGDLGLDDLPHSTLILSSIQNAAVAHGATLSSQKVLTVPPYVVPFDPTQPDASNNLSDGDNRFSACVRRVGDVLYAVHSVELNSRAAIRWYKIDAVNEALLQTDTITDNSLELFYPSIAANEAGIVVIGCNGCSANVFVGCYALAGETVAGTLTFGNLMLLKAGAASYQSPDDTGLSRWGDYSATTVDPLDPNRFWTIQMYPKSTTAWATQITELLVRPARLSIATAGTNVLVSWTVAAGYQLHSKPSFQAGIQWAPITQAPVTNGNQASVLMPLSATQSYFRLEQLP